MKPDNHGARPPAAGELPVPANDPALATPAARLKWARAQRGYKTARAFADAVGVPPPTYFMHESAERGLRHAVIKRYASKLGVSVEWLAYGVAHRGLLAASRGKTMSQGTRNNGGPSHASSADNVLSLRREYLRISTEMAAARENGYAKAEKIVMPPAEVARRAGEIADDILALVAKRFPLPTEDDGVG